jgi:thioredoxin 1
MSETDNEIEEIRERKKEQLAAKTGTPDEPVHVEGADHLEELVGDHHVVLVDFHADWCGPCKMLEPTVETIAAETTAAVAKVDVDAHQDIAAEYGIQGVPTLYLFVDGEPAERLVGVQEESELRNLVDAHA